MQMVPAALRYVKSFESRDYDLTIAAGNSLYDHSRCIESTVIKQMSDGPLEGRDFIRRSRKR